MAEQEQTAACTHCQGGNAANFCAHCGHPLTLRRIDRHYILSEIGKVLNLDKGILFTIKALMLSPGANIQAFIHHDRHRLVKPLFFLIICSLLYTAAQQALQFEDGYVQANGLGDSTNAKILAWVQKNYGYANTIMALFIAFWIKLLFKKYAYNFFEILVLLCFVMGMGMLMYTFFGIAESSTGFKVLQWGSFAAFLYTAWAIGQFFDKTKKRNYVKALFAYLLGTISTILTATAIGLAIDWFNKG